VIQIWPLDCERGCIKQVREFIVVWMDILGWVACWRLGQWSVFRLTIPLLARASQAELESSLGQEKKSSRIRRSQTLC
jgi:hypothetical protein